MTYKQYLEEKHKTYKNIKLALYILCGVQLLIGILSSDIYIGIVSLVWILLWVVLKLKCKELLREYKLHSNTFDREIELQESILVDKEINTVTQDNVKIFISYKLQQFKDIETMYFVWSGGNVLTYRGKWLAYYTLRCSNCMKDI